MGVGDAGGMIRWARKRAGMTQRDLAKAVDMPQPSIARIESRAVVPRTATLIKMLAATGHELAAERAIGIGVDPELIRQQLRISGPQRTRRAQKRGPTRMLRRLRRFGVRFVLIGPLAEAAHGAPSRIGPEVEICHAMESLERLVTALEDLNARPRPDIAALEQDEARFLTDSGELRLTAHPVVGDDFETLWRTANKALVDTGLLVRVAALEDLIRIRRARGTPADHEALELLGALRDELASMRTGTIGT
jgi:transcriptional regulator with XRE-family HTH domain